MSEMSDLQRRLMGQANAINLFTQEEFDVALNTAKAEIMAMAIEASRTAVMMEREACAKIVEEWSDGITDPENKSKEVAELIRNRIPSQRQ
jgi:DNA-binding transcriptional regulator YiaG